MRLLDFLKWLRGTSSNFLRLAKSYVPALAASFPIESLDLVQDFVMTRSAKVAQTTMFGYVKTRMGINYPEMLIDDVMVESLRIATLHHFAGCLSDLALFAAYVAGRQKSFSEREYVELATGIFTAGLNENCDVDFIRFDLANANEQFRERVVGFEWASEFAHYDLFSESPKSLIKWAPIAPDLKKRDIEIAQNSVRFSWIEVRSDFLKRLILRQT